LGDDAPLIASILMVAFVLFLCELTLNFP
jgi:hypothetical protein